MTDHNDPADVQANGDSRFERRRFLQLAGTATVVTGGLALLSACGGDDDDDDSGTVTPTPTASSSATSGDLDIFNFALNLEYLKGSFLSQAALGLALSQVVLPGNVAVGTSGVGTAGTTTGGRAVAFSDAALAQIAREMAYDAGGHVAFLRSALSSAAVAIPAINIAGDATGAFTAVARAAGVVGSADLFDPYASESNFLLAAFILIDPAVAAYKGAAASIVNKTYIEAAAGMLATNAYHAATIRSILYTRGQSDATLIANAQKISDWRDTLDGTSDLDQGIAGDTNATNLVPADTNGIALGRSAAATLNILFATRTAVTQGGFFPSGIGGNVRTSGAN